jgi:hypothetical protein
MRGAAVACVVAALTGSCAARGPIAAPAPLVINEALSADAQICVPRTVFANTGTVCITVGDLRALLRQRRDVVAFATK